MSTEEEELESMRSLHTHVGSAVICCQMAEKLIAFCLTRLFPDQPIQSVEMFEQLDKRKAMLGPLICELRKRVGLDDGFDALLSDFLTHRNALVHDFGRITSHFLLLAGRSVEIKEYALGTCGEAFGEFLRDFSLLDRRVDGGTRNPREAYRKS